VNRRRAPGPPGHRLLGHVRPFQRDALALLVESHRRHGDIVRFRLGPTVVHLLAHPDHIRDVLIDRQPNYDKATRSSGRIRRVTGPGLLTSNGDFWLRQRRLMQPAFHSRQIAAFVDVMTSATAAMLEAWRPRIARGDAIDIPSEMMRLTCTIVARALLGADLEGELGAIEQAATDVMAFVYRDIERTVPTPSWWPAADRKAFDRALAMLDALVHRIIDDRLRAPGDDLVSLLIAAADADPHDHMTREQVRNEVLTLLLAGHETTANSLVWIWHLLGGHPEHADAVRREVADALGDRRPVADDLRQLPVTSRTIKEAMRLYPPIWILERRVRSADDIGGYRLPKGSMVVLCPYVTHRHPAFWTAPDEFDPRRFDDASIAGRHPHAYFPFGSGQRQCIGASFAMTEAIVIVTMVVQRWRLVHAGTTAIVSAPGVTLRSRGPLLMRALAW
jgi:cytochrome P450